MDVIDWAVVGREAAGLLSSYIQIDTANPPGNERAAARFLESFLASRSTPSTTFIPTADRANLLARLEGDGTREPVLLLHHMDVAPANSDRWKDDPFQGIVADGHVTGRGALDDKGLGIMQMIAFTLLSRSGASLKRDVLLLAVADEETGGRWGAGWMVDNHWPEIQCQYLWDEGGSGTSGIMGERPVFGVSVAEKRAMTVKLTARGSGGHGSYDASSPIDGLVEALNRLSTTKMPAHFNEVTRAFLRNIAETQSFPISWLLRHPTVPLVKPLVERKLAAIAVIDAMLRDTITVTAVEGGTGSNMTPDHVEATLDVRLLPSTDRSQFAQRMKSLINDDSITIEMTEPPPRTDPSASDSEFFRSLRSAIQRIVPGAVVTPVQTPVGTDSRYFRTRGVQAYGLLPAVLTPADLNSIHGADERISVDNLVMGTRIIYETLLDLCT